MKKTNKYNLPDRIISVLGGVNPERECPSRNKIHVTQLNMSAYTYNLMVDKHDEIVKDWSDQLVIAQGSALHEAYEKYLSEFFYLREQSFEEEIEGVKLTGTLDLYDVRDKTLISLKQTSVWGPTYKIDDYTKQENCYAWFLHKTGREVDKIYVDIWYRNWQLKQTTWSADYPKIPYERMQLEIWPIEKTEQFIKDQIHYLLMCKDKCTREDKWQKYSVMKNKNKTPSKNCTTMQEAERWIAKYKIDNPAKKDVFKVVDSPPLNCLTYCGARSVCDYARGLKK